MFQIIWGWIVAFFKSADVNELTPPPPAKPQPAPPSAQLASIDMAMPYLLVDEGGYTVDDGGPTMWGIVESDVAIYRGVPLSTITASVMRNLTVAEATAIYKIQYWDAMSMGKLSNQAIATAIFDMGVNFGIRVGSQLAQSAAGVAVDGKIGPVSIAKFNSLTAKQFIDAFEADVLNHYRAIDNGNHAKYDRYMAGWTNRAKRLLTLEKNAAKLAA